MMLLVMKALVFPVWVTSFLVFRSFCLIDSFGVLPYVYPFAFVDLLGGEKLGNTKSSL